MLNFRNIFSEHSVQKTASAIGRKGLAESSRVESRGTSLIGCWLLLWWWAAVRCAVSHASYPLQPPPPPLLLLRFMFISVGAVSLQTHLQSHLQHLFPLLSPCSYHMTSAPAQFSIRTIAQDDRISEACFCPRANLVAFTAKTDINARSRESSFSLYVHSPVSSSPGPPVISTPAASRGVSSESSALATGFRSHFLIAGHLQPLHSSRRRTH
jgi:hypothetical protein